MIASLPNAPKIACRHWFAGVSGIEIIYGKKFTLLDG
jgi:hypothetical protein